MNISCDELYLFKYIQSSNEVLLQKNPEIQEEDLQYVMFFKNCEMLLKCVLLYILAAVCIRSV